MGTNERRSAGHRDLAHKKLRPWEILCEECGAIYDARSEEGLCCHCADHAEEGVPNAHEKERPCDR
jgi:hypothetical protein